jgi:MFS transporter, FSR family, fosmidomycin resistance protein
MPRTTHRALRALLPDGVDRPAVLALTAGHVGSDVFQGAVPALVVYWVAERDWSYAAAGLLVLAGSLASSLLQPLAGAVGDRVRSAWLIPCGLLLAAAGLAGAGLARSYQLTFAALVVGGLGVALFHPEAVRATRRTAGPHAGAAMGFFAVGGNVGFALGPALIAPAVLFAGLGGTVIVALLPLAGAILIIAFGRRRSNRADEPPPHRDEGGPADLPRFTAAATSATLRTAFMFGLMAFVPAWFADRLGVNAGIGSAVVAGMLILGALGTYAGARIGDRVGQTRVAIVSLALVVPLALALPAAGAAAWPLAAMLLFVIGAAMDANFYPLVLIAQDALPGRVGLASGVVIGLSVGLGAGITALIGRLTDAHGVVAALHVCTGIAALALLTALPLARAPRLYRGAR